MLEERIYKKKEIKYMFQDKYKLIRDNYCINLIKYHFGTMKHVLYCTRVCFNGGWT